MLVKIKKLHEDAVIPFYSRQGDAGMDLVAVSKEITPKYIQYKTGLSFEIPSGYVGLIFPRSSNSNIDLIMSNCVAVIDSGYRGEVMIRFKTHTTISLKSIKKFFKFLFFKNYKHYEIGDKVAQIIIIPYPNIEFIEVSELSKTERGEGGFGHTDKLKLN